MSSRRVEPGPVVCQPLQHCLQRHAIGTSYSASLLVTLSPERAQPHDLLRHAGQHQHNCRNQRRVAAAAAVKDDHNRLFRGLPGNETISCESAGDFSAGEPTTTLPLTGAVIGLRGDLRRLGRLRLVSSGRTNVLAAGG